MTLRDGLAMVVVGATVACSSSVRADEPAPRSVTPSTNDLLTDARRATAIGGSGLHAIVRLTVRRGDRVLVRRLEIWSSKDGRTARLRVIDPADLRGTGVLIEGTGGSVRRTLYLPDLRVSRPISTRQSLTQFLSTDLRYADLDLLDNELYQFTLRPSGCPSGSFCLVGRARHAETPYGEVDVLIDGHTRVPTRIRAWDRGGQLTQTIQASEISGADGDKRIRTAQVGQTEIVIESSSQREPHPTELTRAALEDPGS